MSLILNVQPLRERGVRLDHPPSPSDGHLRAEHRKGYTALYLMSWRGGIALLGPLYEPKLTRSEPNGFVLLGFESGPDGVGYVQEWLVTQAAVQGSHSYTPPLAKAGF